MSIGRSELCANVLIPKHSFRNPEKLSGRRNGSAQDARFVSTAWHSHWRTTSVSVSGVGCPPRSGAVATRGCSRDHPRGLHPYLVRGGREICRFHQTRSVHLGSRDLRHRAPPPQWSYPPSTRQSG